MIVSLLPLLLVGVPLFLVGVVIGRHAPAVGEVEYLIV